MEAKPVDLYEFLMESELQHYYNAIKNDLKISLVSHLKYATDDDFKQLGMSRPEIRRLRKFYEKYFPHGYLSKIKRVTRDLLLQNSRKDDSPIASPTASLDSVKAINSPLKMPINKHIIPADAIVVNKQLGVGEFGVVQQGVWTNGNERIQVAIKCLCRERMQSNPMEFLKEAHIMHSIEHENIVRFYGVVLQTDTLMLVTELAPLRSLLECLKDPGLRVSFLTVPTLCEFALQICNGMMYLENKRLIHRDLAARNILVFNKNSVKISDFGLSRALGVGKDYYQSNLNVNLKLPIAWCAPECITFLRFTNASDVWAYAVCLWEMFSYGFQPWAALTGHQIFEAIDEPNFQRLEQPDCCPKDYYILMLKCWEHDPNKRPRFSEIYSLLPDMKPEQLKTRIACNDTSKKDHLIYRQEEIVTVLDKPVNSVYWKGVLNSGKTGYFNPANTVAFMDNFISNTNSLSGSFIRSSERSSKRKLRRDMISRPQNDLKHTGHIGIDGAYFGDVDFLSNAQNHNNHLPRQVVTPYKPSEDEQPLLQPPTPTSPDSIHNFTDSLASTSNRAFVNSNEANANNVHISSPLSMSNDRKKCGPTAFKFPPQLYNSSNPFLDSSDGHTLSSIVNEPGAFSNANMEDDTFSRDNKAWKDEFNRNSTSGVTNLHEYQEISDDEAQTSNVFNSLGPSLLDEVNLMLQSMTSSSEQCPKSPDYDHTSKQSDMGDVSSKLIRNNSYDHNGSGSGTLTNLRNKKKAGVKPLSVKDEKILNHAIDYANEISARSMTDLGAEGTNPLHSPKRKFSLRKPHMSGGSSGDHDPQSLRSSNGYSNTNTLTNKERRNFTEELQNLPDLQNSITKEHEDAYNNLVGNFTTGSMMHYDPEKLSIYKVGQDEFGLSSTLDRCEMRRKEHGNEFNVSKTHTLPVRRSTPIQPEEHLSLDDANPLRILRDKNYPIVRPRLRISTTQPESLEQLDNKDDSGCESPSYVINSDAPFTTDRDINMHSRLPKKELGKKEIENTNPLPLPPRDPNKTLPMYPKRHIRKHPLIIPVSRLQRTLDKVITPSDEKNGPQFRNIDGCLRKSGGEKSKVFELETQDNLNTLDHGKYLPKHCLSDDPGIDIPDSASQCFENILEDRNNKIIELNSPDIVDGFVCFDQPTISSSNDKSIYQNNSEMRDEFMKQMCGDDNIQNFNFDRKKFNFPAKYECQVNDNEKSESDKDVSKTTKSDNCEASLLSNSNSVSCEDLLQFSNRKPMGRERGIDSDEVRLMIKVLGKETDPETYMFVLELVNWDVLKAIKIIKLKNSWQTEFKESLSFERCHDILNEHDWDVRSAIFKRNGFK